MATWEILGGLGSSVIAGGASAWGQAQANKANLKIAREQMRFQEMMSSTAMQRRMRDLKAAGLNPMLAFQLGGASTPGGQTATMQNVGAGVGAAVSTGLQAAMARKQLQLLQQEIEEQTARAGIEKERHDILKGDMYDHPLFTKRVLKGRYAGRLFGSRMEAQILNELMQVAANIENVNSAAALNRAELPARQLTGSTAGGVLRLLKNTPLSVLIPVLRGGKVATSARGALKGARK